MECLIRLSLTLLSLLMADPATKPAGETVSPIYTSWAGHTPGTSVTIRATMKMGELENVSEVRQTLQEVTADKVVIEVTAKVTRGGQTTDAPPQKQEFRRLVPKGGPGGFDPDALANAASERIIVVAGTFDCRRVDRDVTGKNGPAKGSFWISPEVPSGTVRTQIQFDQGTMTTELLRIDRK